MKVKPHNIVICSGVNNLPSQSAEQIIEEIQKISEILNQENFVFCTLPYPPKFCESNGIHDEKMIEKISSINNYIIKLNTDNSQVSLNLHNYGSEFRNKKLYFKYDDWKEVAKSKKLHFSFSIKKKIAQDLSKLSFPTKSEKRINLSRMSVQGHTSLPLATDFIPKITPVTSAVRSIPGLVICKNVTNVKKMSSYDTVVSSYQDKVNDRVTVTI